MDRVALYDASVRLVRLAERLDSKWVEGYQFDTADELREVANDVLKAMED